MEKAAREPLMIEGRVAYRLQSSGDHGRQYSQHLTAKKAAQLGYGVIQAAKKNENSQCCDGSSRQ